MSTPLPPLAHTRIKTRQIVLLVHMDRERSVLRAAEAAGMSQPAASKLLRELEEALGVELFARHARGVEPTAYGEIVVRHAHSVLSEMRAAQEEVESLKRGERLTVSLGTVMNPGTDLVPLAISLLEQRFPKMIVWSIRPGCCRRPAAFCASISTPCSCSAACRCRPRSSKPRRCR